MLRLLLLTVLCALVYISAGQLEVSAAGKPLVLYVHDNDFPDNRVFAFQWKKDGTLEPVAGSPFSTGDNTSGGSGDFESIAFSPRKRLLAVSSLGGVSVFRVAADGALSVVSGSPFSVVVAAGVAFVEKGSHTYLYTTAFSSNQVLGFRAAADGTLAPLPGPAAAAGGHPVGITAAKDLLFVANQSGSISAYKVAANGTLNPAPGSPFDPGGTFIHTVRTDPSGKFVYAADMANTNLYAFKARKPNAALAALAGSPFADPLGGGLAVSKNWIFSIPLVGKSVQAFRRSGSGGLTPAGDPQDAASNKVVAGVFDPTGRFLALVDDTNDKVFSYAVNQSTGELTLLDTETPDLGQFHVTGLTIALP